MTEDVTVEMVDGRRVTILGLPESSWSMMERADEPAAKPTFVHPVFVKAMAR